MFTVLFRTIILYLVVVIAMRIMGKRQIGQLQPFELAIAIMTSELASLPMQDTRIPLIDGIIPIITLIVLQVTISIIQLKSNKARTIICGKPSILIKEGKINIAELRFQRFNINDLLEEMRLQGYYNLDDIEYAILETNGQLSIIPKPNVAGVTKEDLNIKCAKEYLPVTLIEDGEINYNSLKYINKDAAWIDSLLKKNHIKSIKEVFVAILDSKKQFYYQLKSDDAAATFHVNNDSMKGRDKK